MNTFGSGLEWVQKCSMDWKSRWRWTALSWNPEIALWSHPDPLTAFRLVSASHPDQAWCQQIIYDTVDSSATLHCRCLTPNESNLLCMEMYDKSIAFETPQTNFKASLLRRMQYVCNSTYSLQFSNKCDEKAHSSEEYKKCWKILLYVFAIFQNLKYIL